MGLSIAPGTHVDFVLFIEISTPNEARNDVFSLSEFTNPDNSQSVTGFRNELI